MSSDQPLHRFEIEPERSETLAAGGEHKITVFDRGGSQNSQVMRLHGSELTDLYRAIGKYLEGL